MSPWKSLYAMTWILFLEMLLAMTPVGQPYVGFGHIALGLAIVVVAVRNARALRATAVPGRVKRTARSTMQLSVLLAVLGAALVFDLGAGWTLLFGVTVYGLILFAHVVLAIAVLAQAAATGIAYDMWEEKEFLAETRPGEVPELTPEPATPRTRTPRAGS